MKESLRAWRLLVDYMDARWHRDTLGAVLSRLVEGLDAEARYLVYADLHYLDDWTYSSIVGGVGHYAAEELIHRLYSSAIDNMNSNREKLKKLHLIELDTEGQMKTVVELKKVYGWNIAVRIGIDTKDEAKESIRQLANSAGIPIEEDDSVEYDIYVRPEPPQENITTGQERRQLTSWEKFTGGMCSPERHDDKQDISKEYKPDITTGQKEEEQLNAPEDAPRKHTEELDDKMDISEEYKPNITDQKEEELLNPRKDAPEKHTEEDEDDDDISWEEFIL